MAAIDKSHSRTLPKEALRITAVGAVLNLVLVVFKFMAGVYGNSRGLVADAAHSMSDLVSDLVVVWGLIVGSRPRDDSHHYGHAKVELLAEMILGIILFAAGLGIIFDSVKAIMAGISRPPSFLVLPVAALSVFSKEYLYRATLRTAKKTGHASLFANAWHHRSDALTSVGVLLGAGLGMISPSLALADALMGILVAAVVIRVGVGIGWEAAARLVDTAPAKDYMKQMERMILSVPRTRSVRDLKMRYVGHHIAVELHLGLDPGMPVRESHDVAREVKRTVMNRDKRVFDVLVHVEPEESSGSPIDSSG
ncbi:MAG: cation diffusion facilitator family transporter [bacterium]|nr:cation diffusion facilitator family transporter [bacterium]